MGQRISHGTQAVAIELRANVLAIGKNQRGWAVPGLAVLRESRKRAAHIAREQRVILKCGRHEREHCFIDGKAFKKLCFQAIIEAGRVADVLFQHVEPRSDGKLFADLGFFGAKPAAIGNDGIDFAIVRNVAERLGEIPGRLRIGGISLVKNNKGALK